MDGSQSVDHLLQNELSVSDISSVLVLSQPLVKGLACGGMCVRVCVQRGRGEKIEGTLKFHTYTIKFVIPKVQTDYKNHYLLKVKILHSFGRVNTSLVCSKSRLHSHSFALTSLDTFRSHGSVMQCLYL